MPVKWVCRTRRAPSVSFAAYIEAARTAFPLCGRRLHFDHSFAACIEVPHRAPAFACIFTFHLQRASWPPAMGQCGRRGHAGRPLNQSSAGNVVVQSPPSAGSRRCCIPRARACRAPLEASRRARKAAPIACRRSQCPVESATCECRKSNWTHHGCIKVHSIGPARRRSSCNCHRPSSSMSKHVLEHAEGVRSTQCSRLFACRTS